MRILAVLLSLTLSMVYKAAAATKKKPHLIMVLQDDLGFHDLGITNSKNRDVTSNITKLAMEESIILDRHYTHYWCSPTRRSFLTGRLPVHHGEMLSDYNSDDVDLRWSLLSQKLEAQSYTSWWFGKGHTGYKSWHHMPTERGFDRFLGFLHGKQSYTDKERWRDVTPINDTTYSNDLYGAAALEALRTHDESKGPFFLYLPWQAVHEPHTAPPDWRDNLTDAGIYRGMLYSVDNYMGQIVKLLKQRGMWSNTLMVYSSDNGGTDGGNNVSGFRSHSKSCCMRTRNVLCVVYLLHTKRGL